MVRGEASDPRLPAAAVDAILVANTFHELEDPDAILVRAREALRPGGRLVIVDPDADADDARLPGLATLAGFEPAVSTLKGWRAGPLHHRVGVEGGEVGGWLVNLVTLAHFVREYLTVAQLKPSTWRDYGYVRDRHILLRLGRCCLSAITTGDVVRPSPAETLPAVG